jgi:hypothetical protein
MSDRDYYEVLGLTPRADGTMVDQAYWHLARKYQSLATTNARGRRLLDELNEAYGVLGNARLRREYDAFRDDVLVAGGVIGAVPSKPKQNRREEPKPSSTARRRSLPKLRLPEAWRSYGLVALLAVAGVAGAAATERVEIAVLGVAVALVAGAIPVLRRRVNITMPSLTMPALPSVSMPSVSMPSAPQMSMPEVKTPKINLAQVGERFGRTAQDDLIDADELHASTAAVIARWRKRMGLTTPLPGAEPAEPIPLMPIPLTPSNALVEIVESERQIDDGESAPLLAVIDILRGAHKPEGAGTLGDHGTD